MAKVVVEVGGCVPEAHASAECDRGDDDMHVVNEVGVEERSDGGRSTADSNVKAIRSLFGACDGLVWSGVEEMERRVAERE